MRISDWSSDVCSSDLPDHGTHRHRQLPATGGGNGEPGVASVPDRWLDPCRSTRGGVDRYRAFACTGTAGVARLSLWTMGFAARWAGCPSAASAWMRKSGLSPSYGPGAFPSHPTMSRTEE